MLHINDITYRIGARALLDHATVALQDGSKTGLVGRNGSGKTTLFRLIMGEITPESGSISLPKNARIGQVAQEAPSSEESLIEVVLAADTERNALLAEAETATDPHRIAEIQTRLADIDAHSAESRAAAILAGLGFDEETQRGPCSALSGGWRMRVALAAVLFSEPDLLLLDEPTNYLDLEGTLWLESYLARYPRSVLLISHDRDLLNTRGRRHRPSRPGQARLLSRHLRLLRPPAPRAAGAPAQAAGRSRRTSGAHMQAFVDRFRYKASKATPGAVAAEGAGPARADRRDRRRVGDAVLLPRSGEEDGAADRRHGRRLGRLRARQADARPGSTSGSTTTTASALLGANGNGKSTFAKLIAGRLEAAGGRFKRAAQSRQSPISPSISSTSSTRRTRPTTMSAR